MHLFMPLAYWTAGGLDILKLSFLRDWMLSCEPLTLSLYLDQKIQESLGGRGPWEFLAFVLMSPTCLLVHGRTLIPKVLHLLLSHYDTHHGSSVRTSEKGGSLMHREEARNSVSASSSPICSLWEDMSVMG